jgi:hypothetical protein
MPVDDSGQSSQIIPITGETVLLYYSNSGVRTLDAGQVAGVAIQGQLAYENIKDSTGTMSGSKYDTSLTFTAGVFTTEVLAKPEVFESVDDKSFANKLAAITEGLANGEYVVDYINGTIWGKKATNGVNLANTAYKIQSGVTGAPAVISSTVTIGNPWSQINPVAYVASLIIKATPGTLKQVFGYNSAAADQFIQLHDSATLPAEASVPEDVVIARAGSNFVIDFGESGKAFAAGITVCNSSTAPTKTIGAANCWFSAQYK